MYNVIIFFNKKEKIWKKLSIVLCSALALNFAFAVSLADEAKSLGLMPLPKSEKNLKKLIEDSSPDSAAFPTTK